MTIIDTVVSWLLRLPARQVTPELIPSRNDVPPVMLELNRALGAQVTPQLSERQLRRKAQRAARRIQRMHAK